MLKPDGLSANALFMTVRLTPGPELDVPSHLSATGFFFSYKFGDMSVPCLVTCAHFLEGLDSFRFIMHGADESNGVNVPNGKRFHFMFSDFRKVVVLDIDADIAVIPIMRALLTVQSRGTRLFYRVIDETNIPSEAQIAELRAMEEVVMIGYPNGIWDRENNLPIFRRGVTASHPAIPFENKPEGLIDIAGFKGSSGSPVVVLNEGGYFSGKGLVAGNRFHFLGIMKGYKEYTVSHNIYRMPNTAGFEIITERHSVDMPMNLSYYTQSVRLLALKNRVLLAMGFPGTNPDMEIDA